MRHKSPVRGLRTLEPDVLVTMDDNAIAKLASRPFCRPDGIARAQRDLTVIHCAAFCVEEPRAAYRVATRVRTADPPAAAVR